MIFGTARQLVLAGFVVAAVTGCARSTKFEPEKISAATVADVLPEPGPGDILSGRREYRIGPNDKLTVQVFGVQELDRAGQVDAAGYISLPLVGGVMAAGETATSLGQKLEALYGQRYLRNPQISVAVVEAISQQVTIDGAVTRPGIYPVSGNSSLMTIVASANGTTEFARLDEVLVFRTINDKRMVARYSLAQIRSGQAPDPSIFGNDVVIIGSGPGKLNIRDLLLLTPVLGAFYQITR